MIDQFVGSDTQGCKTIKETRALKLLDGSSEYIITYQDKDGDWMLVGDVPWQYVILSLIFSHSSSVFFMRHILSHVFFSSQDVPRFREKTENHENIK